MKIIGRLLLCSFLASISLTTWAACGLEGTVEERVASCQHLPKVNDLKPVTSNSDGIFYYHESEDVIISPLFVNKMPKKCLSPFKKSKKSLFLETPKGSYRCTLKNASRYILLTNEKIR